MTTNSDSDKKITPPHSRPLQKWILFGLVIVGVPLMIYFGYFIKGKNQLKKVQQEYRDTGYPITLQELDDWYPTPVGDNAADLYILAAEQIVNYPDWDPGKKILSAFKRKTVEEDFDFMSGIEEMMPDELMPEGGPSTDIEQESDTDDNPEDEPNNVPPPELENDEQLIKRILPHVVKDIMPELGKRIDPATMALIKSYLQANQQALATIYKATAIKECRYPVDYTKNNLRTDYIGWLRSEARLLELQTLIDTHADHPDKTIQSLLALHAFARSIDREPAIVSRLVTVAIHTAALKITERALNLIMLSDNDLAQLSDEIDQLLKSNGQLRAMVGECVIGNAFFEGRYELGESLGIIYLDEINLPLLKISGLYDRDHTDYLTIMLEHIQATQLPTGQKDNELERIKLETRALRSKHYFSYTLLLALGSTSHLNDRMFVQAIVQKVGLAVERYRLKHGKLPEKLTDLTPEYLEKLPDDPFTSKPLHYKKLNGGGFMVYSTGEDATDDGGQRKNSDGREYVPGTDICFEIRR